MMAVDRSAKWDGSGSERSEEATTDDGDKRRRVDKADTKKPPWKNCFMVQRFSDRDGGQYPRNHGTAFITNLRREGLDGKKYVVLLTAAHVLMDKESNTLLPRIRLLHASDLADAQSDKQGCPTAFLDLKISDTSAYGWYNISSKFDSTARKTCRADYGAIFVEYQFMRVAMRARGGVDKSTCLVVDPECIADALRERSGIIIATAAGFGAHFPVSYRPDGSGKEDFDNSSENHQLLFASGRFLSHLTQLGPHDVNKAAVHIADTSEGTSGGPVFVKDRDSGRYYAFGIHCIGVQSQEFAKLCSGAVPDELKKKKAVNIAEVISEELIKWCRAPSSTSFLRTGHSLASHGLSRKTRQHCLLDYIFLTSICILLLATLYTFHHSPLPKPPWQLKNHLHSLYQTDAHNVLNPLFQTTLTAASIPLKLAHLTILTRTNQAGTGPIFQQEGVIAISELFSTFRSQANKTFPSPRRVMVYGVPGVGKTTYLLKVVPYQWSQGEVLQDRLVLGFSLEHPEVQNASGLDELISVLGISRESKRRMFQEAKEFLEDHDEDVLFIFDALDQSESKLSPYMRDLIRGKRLPKAHIIVTARATASTIEFAGSYMNREVELQPFTLDEATKYLTQQECLRNNVSSNIMTMVSSRQLTVPFYLAMMCDFVKGSWRQIPPTNFLMFRESVMHLFLREDSKQGMKGGIPHHASLTELLDLYRDDITNLQKLAFYGWNSSISIFTSADLQLWNVSAEQMERVGLLLHHGVPLMSRWDRRYTFQHQLFLEFFAAWYMASVVNRLSLNGSSNPFAVSIRIRPDLFDLYSAVGNHKEIREVYKIRDYSNGSDHIADDDDHSPPYFTWDSCTNNRLCRLQIMLGQSVSTRINLDDDVGSFVCGALRQELHVSLVHQLRERCSLFAGTLSIDISPWLIMCLKEMVPETIMEVYGHNVNQRARVLHDYRVQLVQSALNMTLRRCHVRNSHRTKQLWQLQSCTGTLVIIHAGSFVLNEAILEAVEVSVLPRSIPELSIAYFLHMHQAVDFSCKDLQALASLLSTTYNGYVSELSLTSWGQKEPLRLPVCDLGYLKGRYVMLHTWSILMAHSEAGMNLLNSLLQMSMPRLKTVEIGDIDLTDPTLTGNFLYLVRKLAEVSHLAVLKLGELQVFAKEYLPKTEDEDVCRGHLQAAIRILLAHGTHVHIRSNQYFPCEVFSPDQLQRIPLESLSAYLLVTDVFIPGDRMWTTTENFAVLIRAPVLPRSLLMSTPQLMLDKKYELRRFQLFRERNFKEILHRYKFTCVNVVIPWNTALNDVHTWLHELLDLAERYVALTNWSLGVRVEVKSNLDYLPRPALKSVSVEGRCASDPDHPRVCVLVFNYRPRLDYSNLHNHGCTAKSQRLYIDPFRDPLKQ